MNSETHIGPGIRLPPPVIYLAALVTGIVLNSLWAMSPLPGSWRYILGSLLIGVAGLLITPVLRRFRRAGTPFSDFRKAASVLITDGPNRFLAQSFLCGANSLVPRSWYYPQQRLDLALGSTCLTDHGPAGGA